jgi:undecaprenyl-diphosphatase
VAAEAAVGRSALGLVALVALALVAGPVVGTAPVRALDQAVADGLTGAAAARPWLVTALQVGTLPGETATTMIALGPLAVALLIRRQPARAAHVAAAGLGSLVLAPVIKVLVGRLRPVVSTPVAAAPGPSFPSGHTLSATVLVGVLLLVALPVLAPRARRPVVVAGVAVVALVGVTRFALGVHFLSDVVAGWLIGAAWLVVTAGAFRSTRGVNTRGVVARGLAVVVDHT